MSDKPMPMGTRVEEIAVNIFKGCATDFDEAVRNGDLAGARRLFLDGMKMVGMATATESFVRFSRGFMSTLDNLDPTNGS